jgi:hypothetical protein
LAGQYPDAEIQSLIAWREHVLSAASRVGLIGGPRDGFRYRPGELLVAEGVQSRLQSLRPDLPAPTPIVTAVGTILHYRSPMIRVPSVLSRVKATKVPELVAGIRPNLVFGGEQAYQGFPGGWPKPKPPPPETFSGTGDGPIVGILDTGYTIGVHDADGLDSRFGDWGPPITPEKIDVTQPHGWRDFEAGHSTFICGIIAQGARSARLRLVPTLNSAGFVDEVELVGKIAELGQDVDILNLSLGGFSHDDMPPIALAAAIASLPPETAVVAAAGNAGPREERPFWPAALHRNRVCEDKVVFAVGAQDHDGTTAAYSTEPADIYAPGDHASAFIVFDETASYSHALSGRGPQAFEGYASWVGTSFATAAVAARIAEGMADGRSAVAVARDVCSNAAAV